MASDEIGCQSEKIVIRVALFLPLRTLFDYLPPLAYQGKIISGMRILVPFGKKKLLGVIMEVAAQSKYQGNLKTAYQIVDQEPILSPAILKLINWASDYYHHPIGEVVASALPAYLRKNDSRHYKEKDKGSCHREKCDNRSCHCEECEARRSNLSKLTPGTFTLNTEQTYAVSSINQSQSFNVYLLDGVTGSGKTEVYLNVIAEVIAQGKQALVLVPEINLTPQTVARFQKRFPIEIAVFHSRMSEKEKFKNWDLVKQKKALIIIGTRSAIFTPLADPGIIILDEEHDASFKQQSGFRYHARDLAVIRAKQENIPVVLGSATPSLESINNVMLKKYQHLILPNRATGSKNPTFNVVDLRGKKLEHGFAPQIVEKMKKHLENEGQILVFVNRRGFASAFLCKKCGWIADCQSCSAHLTFHRHSQKLICHHCDRNYPLPEKCEQCGAEKLIPVGLGTERIENNLKKVFPEAILTRVDRDTTGKKDSMSEVIKKVAENTCQILIGTQMLAKGHHFPDVTMVVILNADQGLFSSDFRASENLAQLIVQVSGRAGREKKPGEVYIQTYNPNHPLLLNLINSNYWSFAKTCLLERKEAELPPFSHLALLRAEHYQKEKMLEFLTGLREKLGQKEDQELKILGPISSILEKKGGKYRAQLLFQATKRGVLKEVLARLLLNLESNKKLIKPAWLLEIDPLDIF
jgi:primosomal protein N' (replication factor Y) (superfamily II helicase)